LGVFIAPTTKLSIWWGCLLHGAPDSPVHTGHVRCASHITKAVGFWPLELWLLGPPGCPVAHQTCTVECPVRQHGRAWLLRALARNKCAAGSRWRRNSRCPADTPDSPVYTGHIRWIIAEPPLQFPEAGEFLRPLFLGAPDTVRCTLDSPVNYSGVASGISRRWRVWVGVLWCTGHVRWCTGHCPVAHRTVRCARPEVPSVAPLLFCWTQYLVFLLAKCEPLAPV
jgi:hypothetical protein